ncbi:unnamed protein product [Protopolystoma xenopodis]|uniref:Uncharacterized protein n=1 Tax=Protopolystoma xenopodis TaxID=117903 RepID=A0A448XA20_9PLAT|nr:unnamed protein product [Protopolystoma xenopodis]
MAYDGRRRITRSKMGELCMAVDQAMGTDGGRYALTLTPSDPNAPADLEPIVLNSRVEVRPKLRKRTG